MKKIMSVLFSYILIFNICCVDVNIKSFADSCEIISDEVLSKIEKVLNEPSKFQDLQRKSRDERKQDLINIYKQSGRILFLYNIYGLDIKNFRNYNDFFGGKDTVGYVVKKNAQKRHKYKHLANKKEFEQYMREVCPECIPKTYFFMKDGKVEDGELAGQSFVSAVSSLADNKYFFKAVKENQGTGVFLIEKVGKNIIINNGNMSLDEFLKEVNTEREFIMQERIVQHPDLAKFNPGTTNTVRIVTTKFNKNAHVFAATLRIGSNKNAYLDNAHQGGTFVGVDDETGKLKEWGYYAFADGKTREKFHPVSNIVYLNQQIPYWKETLDLVKKLHTYCDYYTSIGWDVVITENGPKIIELNTYWANDIIQGPHGGLKQKWEELRHAE